MKDLTKVLSPDAMLGRFFAGADFDPTPDPAKTQKHDFGYLRDNNFRISVPELRDLIAAGKSCREISRQYRTTCMRIALCAIEFDLIELVSKCRVSFFDENLTAVTFKQMVRTSGKTRAQLRKKIEKQPKPIYEYSIDGVRYLVFPYMGDPNESR